MTEKNKSGAGKFLLGALLGGIAGAVAGKFIKVNPDDGEEVEDECNCGDDCKCANKPAEKPAPKTESKKTTKKQYPQKVSGMTLKPSDFVHLHNHTHYSLLDGLT